MFFNRRQKYNGQVAALLPAFGFNLEESGVIKTADVLDIAWKQKYSEYEGALYVAYLVFSGMLKAGQDRADEVMRRVRYVQADWVSKRLVREELAERFSAKAEEWINEKKESPTSEFNFTPNMPDITRKEPIGSYIVGPYLMLVAEDVPPIGEHTSGVRMPLRFPYAMVALDTTTRRPCMFVTLETGFTDGVFLCVFGASGGHDNLGDGSAYCDAGAFENIALDIMCESLGLTRNDVRKISR